MIGESVSQKKGGLLSMFTGNSTNNAIVENVRLTLIMTIGYIAKYAHPE